MVGCEVSVGGDSMHESKFPLLTTERRLPIRMVSSAMRGSDPGACRGVVVQRMQAETRGGDGRCRHCRASDWPGGREETIESVAQEVREGCVREGRMFTGVREDHQGDDGLGGGF
jgi:hypothetical protein